MRDPRCESNTYSRNEASPAVRLVLILDFQNAAALAVGDSLADVKIAGAESFSF